MVIKYGADIEMAAVAANIKRLTNQIYKLLPLREEGGNWSRPLEALIEEIAGMDRLLIGQHLILFKLLSKLEGLLLLTDENDFMLYRSVIFECLGLLGELNKCLD